MVIVAWFVERQGRLLRFKRSPDAMWRHFEHDTLVNSTKKPEQKSRSLWEVAIGEPIVYLAPRFMSSEYGYKVLARLCIKEDFQRSADEWFESHIKGDWVAVHYRGTDIRVGKKTIYECRYRIELKPYVTYLQRSAGQSMQHFCMFGSGTIH